MTSIFSPMTTEDKADIDNLDTLSFNELFHFVNALVAQKKLDSIVYLAHYFKKYNISLVPQFISKAVSHSWLQISTEFTSETYDMALVNGYHFQMFRAVL